jgi:hypothetical protein
MRSDMRVKELTGTLQAIFDISGSILWETVKLKGENADVRLRQAERAIGLASSIHTLPSKYISNITTPSRTELTALVERGIIWTLSMLWNIETSVAVKEVWLVTPDLKPDISDPTMGEVVAGNLKKGKRYVYFVPATLGDLSELTLRLKANVGIDSAKSRSGDRITMIQVDAQDFWMPLGSGNLIFFFNADPKSTIGISFREIVFTQITERGFFWQECAEAEAECYIIFCAINWKAPIP